MDELCERLNQAGFGAGSLEKKKKILADLLHPK